MTLWPWARIRELERENIDLKIALVHSKAKANANADELRSFRNQVDFLIRSIRKTDDIIFSISQCLNWESMRPRVAQLVDQMTARKVAESDRINSLVVSELHDTYQSPNKQIENK